MKRRIVRINETVHSCSLETASRKQLWMPVESKEVEHIYDYYDITMSIQWHYDIVQS